MPRESVVYRLVRIPARYQRDHTEYVYARMTKEEWELAKENEQVREQALVTCIVLAVEQLKLYLGARHAEFLADSLTKTDKEGCAECFWARARAGFKSEDSVIHVSPFFKYMMR